jgi:signal transduction histidine kinase/ActR/RegA family two-component response regulator
VPLGLQKFNWKSLGRTRFGFSLALVTLVILVGISVLYFRVLISERVRLNLSDALQTVLKTTQGGIRIWERDLRADMSAIVALKERRVLIEDGLKAHAHKNSRELRRVSLNLDKSLAPWMNEREYLGYVVVSHDGQQVFPVSGNQFNSTSFPEEVNRAIADAFAGKLVLTLPFDRAQLTTDPGTQSNPRSALLLATPVRNLAGNVIAVLGLFLDPMRFTELTQLGQMGQTGETYAVDRSGRMLTKTRFDESVSSLVRAKFQSASSPFLKLRDPGGNLLNGFSPVTVANAWPLTKMASSIARSESGTDLDGYRDYRGIKVVGAWIWDQELGIGLATEMDGSEAYKTLSMINRLTSAMIASLVLGSILSLFLFHLRDKAQKNALASEKVAIARQELLATVSHDLKNPLNAILLHDELLLRTLPEFEGSAKRKKSLESLKRAAEQMRRLIEDLLLGAKLDAGGLTLEERACPIEWLSTRLHDIFDPIADEKGLTLNHEIRVIDETLWIDPARILQVLSNLIGNAIKFTPKGGVVSVVVQKANAREIQISISDNGSGIAASELEHVFDRYWQAEKTAKFGTGLGLSISKQLVEAHGGRIWAESTPGVGSTFSFTIPSDERQKELSLLSQGEKPNSQQKYPQSIRLDRLRILLADDSSDVRDLFELILKSAGAIVTTAEDGNEAVRKARAADFDVVLMDLQMPGMDGFSAAAELRSSGYERPIVALTATAPEKIKAKISASGFSSYLSKPIDRSALLAAISKFESLSRTDRTLEEPCV